MSFVLSRYLVFLPKPTRPPVAQFFPAWTFVVDPLPDSQHFLIPVVAGAHRDAERVASLPNCLSIDENQPMKFRLLRLCRMVDSAAKAAVYHETSLAFRIYTTPTPGTGAVASSTLCFPATEDARWVRYRGADSIPREDQVE